MLVILLSTKGFSNDSLQIIGLLLSRYVAHCFEVRSSKVQGWDCAIKFSSLLYSKITKFDTSYFKDQGMFLICHYAWVER